MFYTYTKDPIGVFVEKDHGNWFEYSVNDDLDADHLLPVPAQGVGWWARCLR
jgi:hypothetical protein